jgi:hypothetical protein
MPETKMALITRPKLYMLTQSFQQLIIVLVCLTLILLIILGIYCRRRYNSYIGTGRVTEIEAWYARATFAWVGTFCLSLVIAINYF